MVDLLAIQSVGQLALNISLFSGGIAFAILSMIFAASRSVTKNSSHWAMLFSALSWLFALIIPNVWFSGIIFGFGAIGLTLSFMPMLEQINDKNILVIASIVIVMNSLLVFSSDLYDTSLQWQENLDQSILDIQRIAGVEISSIDNNVPEYTICPPNKINEDGTPCNDDLTSGTFIEDLFVPFASVLTIGTYIGKAVAFIGNVALAPTVLSRTLASEAYFKNPIILILMGFLINLWQISIFYKLILFVLNKYGAK